MVGRPGQRSQNWVIAESGHREKVGWELRAVLEGGWRASQLSRSCKFLPLVSVVFNFFFLVAFICLAVSYMLYRNTEE